MNLEQSITLSKLRSEPREIKAQEKSKLQVGKLVTERCKRNGYPYKKLDAAGWAHKFLSSKEFVLMRVDINAAASPHEPRDPNRVKHYLQCNAEEQDPIVIDRNKNKVGRSHLGYVPKIMVVDGKHRKQAAMTQGHTTIMAWVGKRALKYIKPLTNTLAASRQVIPTPVGPTKMDTTYAIHAATVPAINAPVMQQDVGQGGSRPKDLVHATKKVEECNACGARSSGSLLPGNASDDKVPPDASDAGSSVNASDQRKWDPNKPQIYPSGAKPGDANRFASPPMESPGSGVGPRVKNTGASTSEMARNLHSVNAGGPGSGRKAGSGKVISRVPGKRPSGRPRNSDKDFEEHQQQLTERGRQLMGFPNSREQGNRSSSYSTGHSPSKIDAKGKLIKKIVTKKKKIKSSAPPGREAQVKTLKKKFPKGSGAPFAIAWDQANKGKKK